MPRLRTILQSDWPYHITARCINREWFGIPTAQVWQIFCDYSYLLHHGFGFEIQASVLMNNHYHALLFTPKANLDEGMGYFQREVSREISKAACRINQTWGGPYHWSIVNSNFYFMNAYKYVYRNPVEAGIVNRCEEYPFSTLNGLLGFSRLHMPVREDTLLFTPELCVDHLEWLNRGKSEDFLEVGLALKKPYFQFQYCEKARSAVRRPDFVF